MGQQPKVLEVDFVPMSSFSSCSSPSFASYGATTTHPRAAPVPPISCGPRPRRKQPSHNSEAQELVRLLTHKISDKEPLLKTLNKYVKQVRTEHCFLLFEQLGKEDKWLQCIEVPSPSLSSLSLSLSLCSAVMKFVSAAQTFSVFGIFIFTL
ncbi:unnamed protein product [Sphenostylis stenocarpa]|uniref:Uncharacterized protein n=1 Tax=Sphenostylis stenocarpa TaxID=92480 RepID=A0AA86S7K6_9FABA|nr:unnamed protein product [Sphenostylis stenocarpa]